MNEIEKIKRKFDSDIWCDNADEIVDFVAVILFIILIVSIICALLRRTKFCPECGELYQSNFEYCQYDGAELKTRGEK